MRTYTTDHSTYQPLVVTGWYRKVFPAVASYVQRHGGSYQDAEDILQEGILQLIATLKDKPSTIQKDIHSYLYGTCRNLWRNELRSAQRKLTKDTPIQVAIADQKEAEQPYESQYNLFQKYFVQLHNSSQKLWQLWFEGNSITEIATTMGYTEGYVRKKKSESKKTLLQWIQNELQGIKRNTS